MHRKQIFNVLGALWIFLGTTMLLALPFSIYYGDGDTIAILLSAGITIGSGFLLWVTTRGGSDIRVRDGFAIVTFGWITSALFGMLPFLLSSAIESPVNAFFESMSGFTTTGASILTDIEALPHGILFWRSLTHWLGGMGIIVFSLAILPMLGIGASQLYKAEAPGPTKDRFTPRIRETAKLLWITYILISIVEVTMLWAGGMEFFDSVCHTFGTMATGGFSTKNASIAHYNSAYFDYVIIFFMILAGSNFALHFRMFKGDFTAHVRDKEFRFYLGAISAVSIIVLLIVFMGDTISPDLALRHSLFQVVSIITTTGYITADYELWLPVGQLLMVALMFVGACASSTGGSMKIIRVTILMKHALYEIRKLVHPTAVYPVKLGDRIISDDVIKNVLAFFLFYMAIFVVVSIIMAGMGLDILSAVSVTASALGNIGPALGSVGPTDNYFHLPAAAKLLLNFCMLLGRLELFTVIVLFSRTFWKRK